MGAHLVSCATAQGIDRETIKDTSFTSTSFRMAPETWGVYHWAAVSAGRQKTQTRPDLPYYADWTSCALVGSSGSLTGTKWAAGVPA